MLDYDVPSDDEDYDPAQRRRGDTDSLGAPTPRTGVDTGVSSPAPFGDDYSVGPGGSQRGEGDEDGREDDDDDEDSDEAGSGYDSDLAKEIEKDLNMANKGQGGTDESGSDDDDGDGLFGGSSDDDDDDDDDDAAGLDAGMGGTGTSGVPDDAETVEARKRLKLLAEEMGDLDRAIAAKEVELAKAPNPIFKVRAPRSQRSSSSVLSLMLTAALRCVRPRLYTETVRRTHQEAHVGARLEKGAARLDLARHRKAPGRRRSGRTGRGGRPAFDGRCGSASRGFERDSHARCGRIGDRRHGSGLSCIAEFLHCTSPLVAIVFSL